MQNNPNMLSYNLENIYDRDRFESEQPDIANGKYCEECKDKKGMKYKWYQALLDINNNRKMQSDIVYRIKSDDFFNESEKMDIIDAIKNNGIKKDILVFRIVPNDRIIDWLVMIKK